MVRESVVVTGRLRIYIPVLAVWRLQATFGTKVFIKYLQLGVILKQILTLKKKQQNNLRHTHNTELKAVADEME